MDLLTRKKFLLRKYNNNIFSHEQVDFFSKINASEITLLLKENPHLRECPLFFQHLPIRQIEKIIASVFEPEQGLIRSEVFNILVNLLRNSTMLLEICFKRNEFNYMSIFGFLQEEHVDYPVLILLEDVLLPFIRKSPFQILEVITNDDFVEDIILKRIYQKPIFKIMYTIIFCLSRRHSQTHKVHVKKIIHELVQTPFTYLLHKQKFMTQKISIIAMDKTQLKGDVKNDIKSCFEEISKSLSQIHTKKVKQKRIYGSSFNIKDFDSPKLRSKKSFESSYKIRLQSQSQESLSPPKRMRHQFSLHISELDELSQNQISSLKQIKSHNKIIFNENLDYSDLTSNMKQLLSDIAFNLKSVDLGNLLVLLSSINETYINGLVQNCQRLIRNEQYEGYCQGSINILIQCAEVYKAAVKMLPSTQDVKNGSQSSTNSELDTTLYIVIAKLQQLLRTISLKIPLLCNCVMENNQTNQLISSGQKVKILGFTKFRVLQLIHLLLQFNAKNNPHHYKSLNLQIDFAHFDMFLIIQKYLTSLKWNNLLHCLLVKLAKLSLEQDYQNFKKRYIEELEKPKDGILGTLMQIFRNKKFVFLKNMQFTNNGNLHAVYEIFKSIIQIVKAHNDYVFLIQKFPAFDSFVSKDLVVYEKLTGSSQLQIHDDPNHPSELLKSLEGKEEMAQKQFKTTIESASDSIHEMENAKRWAPPSALTLRSMQMKPCF